MFLTEIEAAYSRSARRFAVPRNTALDEAEKLRALIARFRSAIENKVKRATRIAKPKPGQVGPANSWEPSLDDCKAVQAITTAAERAVAMEERLRKMIEAERKGYTPEQLELVWRDSLKRSAADLPAADWWDLLRIRFGDDVARVLIRMAWSDQVLAAVEGS